MRQGLLHPNGYRDYQDADIATVAWIRRLLAAGLSTGTIGQFPACAREDLVRPPQCGERLVGRLREERAGSTPAWPTSPPPVPP
ncbi:MAG: hypothetical protein V7637_348 [Mycobacteriales bacterium]